MALHSIHGYSSIVLFITVESWQIIHDHGSDNVTSTSQHQIFDKKFDQKPESVRIKMADLAGR